MQIICIANQKGGVGKTTTAHILLTGLTHAGYKTLGVDIDPQTNLTYTAGIEPEARKTVYDLFKGKPIAEAIQTTAAGFDMISGSIDLAGADMEFTQIGKEYILRDLLEPVKENYDFCIIDTPPTLGILTVNALTAAQKVIIPMLADVYSLQGLSQLQTMIQTVQHYCNPSLTIDGLLLTKYSPRAVINQQLKENLEELAKQLNTKLYSSVIREAVAIKEIQLAAGDLFRDNPKANITKDYKAFISEFTGKDLK